MVFKQTPEKKKTEHDEEKDAQDVGEEEEHE